MPTIFDPLVELIHSRTLESWKGRNNTALATLFGSHYHKRAGTSVALRAPDMRGSDAGVPYGAFIHPSVQRRFRCLWGNEVCPLSSER